MKNLVRHGAAALPILFALLIAASGCSTPAYNSGAIIRDTALTVPAGNPTGPDLVITDVTLQGCQVFYTIKNIGATDAGPTTTQLYINGVLPPAGGSSFVDVLKAGQEMNLTFSNYPWPWCSGDASVSGSSQNALWPAGGSQLVFVDPSLGNITLKVCANAKNEISESNSGNNCFTQIMGVLMDYSLIPRAHLAAWTNGTVDAPVAGVEGSPYGAYIKNGTISLEMVPNQVPQGWIQGTWGAFYTDSNSGSSAVTAIKVPAKLHFKARVGLSASAVGSDGVTFRFGTKDLSGITDFTMSKKMTVPGQFEDWDIDLSVDEGQICYFVLRVDAGDSPVNDFAVWDEARLVQIND